MKDFTRKIKIHDVFSDKENEDISIHRNKSNRQIYTQNQEINDICNLIELLQPIRVHTNDNLTPEERSALEELTSNNDLIIKQADKSGNFVLMDKTYYRDSLVLEGHLNSNAYEKIPIGEDKVVVQNLRKLVNRHKDSLTDKEQQFITDFEWKTSNFYVLPKIHKSKEIIGKISSSNQEFVEMSPPTDLKGRPIVAGPVSPTQRLSEFIDTLIKPIVSHLNTYIKDDWDFLRKIPYEFSNTVSLYSYDITSLYTSIPHSLGLEALTYWIEKRRDLIPIRFSNDFIIESAKFVLENNNFLFDNELYRQIKGTAMGTKFAPSYACLTIGFLEETRLFPTILCKYFDNDTCKYIEKNYIRYMDDSFITLPKNLDPSLLQSALNEMDTSIKFTMEKGQTHQDNTETLNFLDIKIILRENKYITTDIYYKETNPHKYLDYHSAHPSHVKQTIPFNLAKRIIVFVSDPDLIEVRLKELEKWLIDCNYPKNIIKQAFHRAKLQGPAPDKSDKHKLPLVTTHYPDLQFSHMMKTINSLLYNLSPTTKEKFQNTQPVLALKQPPNISSILTNARFSSAAEIPTTTSTTASFGITLCKDNRCKLCKLYLQAVNSFKTAKNVTWNIKCNISCKSKNVVYFLSCNSCHGKVTYIGQTTNFRLRMNNHISESRSGVSSCTFPRHVFQCGNKHNNLKEPFFKVFAFMSLSSSKLLTTYEEKLFKAGHATLN